MKRTIIATTLAIACTGLAVPAAQAADAPGPHETTFQITSDGDGASPWKATVDGQFALQEGDPDGLSVYEVWANDSYDLAMSEQQGAHLLGARNTDSSDYSNLPCKATDTTAPTPAAFSSTDDSFTMEEGEKTSLETLEVSDETKVVQVHTMNCQLESAARTGGDYLLSTDIYVRTEKGGEFTRVAGQAMEATGREGSTWVWETEEGWEWLEAYSLDTSAPVPADKQWFADDEWPKKDGPVVDTGRTAEAGTPWAALLVGGGLLGLGGLVTTRGVTSRAR